LRQLERAILEQESVARGPRRERAAPGAFGAKDSPPSSRPHLAGLLTLGGVAAILAVALSGEATRSLAAAPNSISVVDGRRDLVRTVIKAGGEPGGIAAGAGAVWVTDTASTWC
jgi:hypothetical protein